MFLETPLFFKTMLILSGQLGIVLSSCFYCIKRARKAYENKTTFLGTFYRGSMNMKKGLDLIPDQLPPDTYPTEMVKQVIKEGSSNGALKQWVYGKPEKEEWKSMIAMNKEQRLRLLKEGYKDKSRGGYIYSILFFIWFASLFASSFFAATEISTITGIILFTIQSLTFGPILALVMLEMDENDGFKALQIVLLVTIVTGIIGYSDIYSFSESASMALFLFISLLGLIIFSFIRIFRGFSRKTIRIKAIFGAFIFSLYLLFDFNYLRKKAELGINDWETAFNIAFNIYLDIINLLLEILDAMSNS